MPQTKRKALTDDQVLQACKRRAESASVFTDSKLAQERRETAEYYQGLHPKPTHAGNSSYVSLDVQNSVDAMRAQLLETFAAGSNIVSFKPRTATDTALARVSTAYTEYQIFQLNDGLEIFSDVMTDGLMARNGVAKVYWERNIVETEHSFQDIDDAQLTGLLSQDQVELKGKPQSITGPNGLTHSGTITVREDQGQVRIEPIAPEEFVVVTRTKDLRRAPYVAHRTIKTLGELVDDGFDPKTVYAIKGDTDELEMNEEAYVRRKETEDAALWGKTDDDAFDEAGREVTVYESYIRIDKEGKGFQRLWRVVHAGDTLLSCDQVERLPFMVFRPLPMPHTFWGSNYAQRAIPAAKVKTVVTRGILDATVRATVPRYKVVKGGLTNPRELVDGRPGGIVNVNRADAVLPLEQPALPPQVFQVIDRADADREDNTGISRLSQGLSKDAVSQQNSAGLVEQLTTNSQVRQKIVARHFATQFLKELYIEVYQLCIENENSQRIFEVAGEFVEVSPADWASRKDVTVDLNLGYGQRDAVATEILGFHKLLSGDASLGRLYDEGRKYEVLKRVLDVKGYKDTASFLNDPHKLGPPQPDPKSQLELKKLEADITVATGQQALREKVANHEMQVEDIKLTLQKRVDDLKALLGTREADRKDRETENRIDVALAELELAADALRTVDPANEKATAIISPNS